MPPVLATAFSGAAATVPKAPIITPRRVENMIETFFEKRAGLQAPLKRRDHAAS
jgi:hypothetical protein